MGYTKGEWKINKAPSVPGLYGIEADGHPIASVNLATPEVEANAQLIAAAPELYEALKEIVRWMREWENPEFHFGHLLEWAEKALAKAEGK